MLLVMEPCSQEKAGPVMTQKKSKSQGVMAKVPRKTQTGNNN